jgi:hypothetical protein
MGYGTDMKIDAGRFRLGVCFVNKIRLAGRRVIGQSRLGKVQNRKTDAGRL